jgi:hypothetical protein
MAADLLATHAGEWTGTNGFRLMPADELAAGPAAATVRLGAGGHLTSLAYEWVHPEDGPQDGVLLLWAGEGDVVHAVWGDSWHQQPEARALSGTSNGSVIELEAGYGGGWRWRIAVEATDPAQLRVVMSNVVPADQATEDGPAGPYPAMITELTRVLLQPRVERRQS